MAMSIRISAVVCTHNRSNYLRKAIQSLVDQTLPKEQYEVIVVDNGSTDDTRAIVESFEQLENVRYIYEPLLGLSQARNTGWQNARGEYVSFLDDDAIACPEWLERILTAFETVHPKPGSVGGKVVPIWETERPTWLPKKLERPLTVIDWADSPLFLTEDYQFLAGANVAYPREILEEFGGFSTSLGRKGSNLSSGEETLLKRRLKSHNLGDYYDPEICVQHHITRERLVRRWFYKRAFWNGISREIVKYLDTPRPGVNLIYILRALLNTLGFLAYPVNLLGLLMPARSANQMLRKWHLYSQLGRIWAQVRIGFGLVRGNY